MQASASYPVHFLPAYHEQQSRLATLLRALLAIPHQIVAGIYGYLAYLVSIVAWFAILITGRYPASLFRLNEGYVRYQARVNAYTWLLNDRFPPFGPGSPGDGYPLRAGVDEQASLSRLSTFFRWLLLIPAAAVLVVLEVVLIVAGIAAWIVILFTGRLPQGLFEALLLALRYSTRLSAYQLLLSDRFPWFQPEDAAP